MRRSIQAALLFLAAALMLFAAAVQAAIAVPHLRADLIEIQVRPTLLRAVVLALWFGPAAMLGFALIVLTSAVQAVRGKSVARPALIIVALIYLAFGLAAFAVSRSPHTLGFALAGLIAGIAATIDYGAGVPRTK